MKLLALVRVEPRLNPRLDWELRWTAAGKSVGWSKAWPYGSRKDYKMVAEEDSPIWEALGEGVGGFRDATGSDTPPFAFSSGMGWVQVGETTVYNSKKGNTMNAKEKLIRIILNLSDGAAGEIVGRISHLVSDKMLALPNERDGGEILNSIALATNKFDESKHPRAADGKWTSGAPSYMGKGDAGRWEKTGKMSVSPKRFPETLKKITEAKKRLEYWESQPGKSAEDFANTYKRKLVAAQRELAEKMREFKHQNREKLEGKAKKKHNDKLVKEYRDLEDDIDYTEEKYADRESGSLTELKWPKGKKGEKEKAKYEKMKKRRDELHAEIDWDLVKDDDEVKDDEE